MVLEDEEEHRDSDSDSDSESEYSGSDSDSETEIELNSDFELEEQSNLYQLQGLRWFFQRAEGEEIDEEEEEIENPFELEPIFVDIQPMPPSLVSTSLKNNGVTYEDLVKVILYEHEDYERNENCRNICDETWEKIHRIILNREEMDMDTVD